MLFLLLSGIALFFAYKMVFGYEYYGFEDFVMFGLMSITGIGIAFLLTIPFMALASPELVKQEHINVHIISLTDSKGLHGQFVMGSGYINGGPCYSVFYKEQGGLAKWNFRTDNTIIYQDATNADARIEFDKTYYKIPSWIFPWDAPVVKESTYMIHVPADTVIERFQVQ